MLKESGNQQKYVTVIVLVLAVIGLSGGGYFSYSMAGEIVKNTTVLEEKILELEDDKIILTGEFKKEKEKNGVFETQIGQISGTIGKLDKLSKTDKELLQKYSKIYFLNENYVPKGLIEISSSYVFGKDKVVKILASTSPFLLQLMNDAKKDGIDLLIISGFRSFNEQSDLKDNYKVIYGTGANKFSADQGYSEHQLGTTVDFTTMELGANFTNFEKSNAYKWLLENAYRYGFIISYPKENSYYQFEPWHWRFVGKKLAQRLHEEKQNFYDMSQRQIDAYLINIFD